MNQYTNVVTPGYKHIAGVAFATNTVTVNDGATERRGEWFDREITINNSGSPVWQTVAAVSANVTSNGGFAFPKNQQALSYDEDGNLTQDGIWTYEWDAENRLITMGMTDFTGLEASNRLRLDFAYDYMGRRFSKTVSTWDLATETFTNAPTQYFVYDLGGWNLLAVLNSSFNVLNSFMWGQDVSGTMTEAGGVGGYFGLLEVSSNTVTNCHFAMYDGNGNITGLVKSDKTNSARYEYSAYGATLRTTGPLAILNPFRFSTKFHDHESRLVYYGYRYYSPMMGRWISGDPAEENAAPNLRLFCHNNALSRIDSDGRADFSWDSTGFHIRDGGQTYVPIFNDDGSWDVAQKGEHAFDPKAAKKSLDRIMGDEDLFQKMKNRHTFKLVEGGQGLRAWDFYAKGSVAQANSARALIRQQGRNMWRAARKAGKVLGVLAIFAAVESSSKAADIAQSYAKNRGTPYADLDAVDLAMLIQQGTDNYFMGYLALDYLLQ